MEKISVIVPVFKVEQYLDRCVESIVDQTYTNLEIILVDDGSPDNCPEMCDKWAEKDDRIKVVHKTNGGLSDARNAGMKIATGDYVAFVDSDDWIERCYIEFLYRAICEKKADVAACEIRIVTEDEICQPILEKMPAISLATSKDAMKDLLQGKGFRVVAWNKLYRKTILQGETFEVGKLHEDEFFTYRIYDKAQRLTFVPVQLYNYVQRSGSIMKSFSIRHLDVLDAYLRRLELLRTKYPEFYSKEKVGICISCVNYYCEILTNNNSDIILAKKRIQKCRRKVKINWKEYKSYTWKERIYCVCSLPVFLDFFCKVRIKKANANEEK